MNNIKSSSSSSSPLSLLTNATYRRNTRRRYHQQYRNPTSWFSGRRRTSSTASSASISSGGSIGSINGFKSNFNSISSSSSSSSHRGSGNGSPFHVATNRPWRFIRLTFATFTSRSPISNSGMTYYNYNNYPTSPSSESFYYNTGMFINLNNTNTNAVMYNSPHSQQLLKRKRRTRQILLFFISLITLAMVFLPSAPSSSSSQLSSSSSTSSKNNHGKEKAIPQRKNTTKKAHEDIMVVKPLKQKLKQHHHHQQRHKTQDDLTKHKTLKTGAWANCTNDKSLQLYNLNQIQQHPDQRMTMVSCHLIKYRIQKSKFLQDTNNPIMIGVLSSAGTHTPLTSSIVTSSSSLSYNVGFQKRQSIRETWAKNQTNVFFIVAQPFSTTDSNYNITNTIDKHNNSNNSNNDTSNSTTKTIKSTQAISPLEQEYNTYGDLIWIDEDEVYDGEKSVLTYKTLTFVNIVHDLVVEYKFQNNNDVINISHEEKDNEELQHSGVGAGMRSMDVNDSFVKYIFKTDDDCYVHIPNLKHHLSLDHDHNHQRQEQEGEELDKMHHNVKDKPTPTNLDYWGQCSTKEVEPLRSKSSKWPVSYELYPEELYPRYCQGAGFALSWKFINCAAAAPVVSAVSSGADKDKLLFNSHISNARFMPFEDVAMGLIAQRCEIEPTPIQNKEWIHMYRFDRSEERWRVNQGLERMAKKKLPKPNMDNGRFVQHRIYDDWDMREHHKVVIDKDKYDAESKVEWYYRPDK